MHAGFTVPLDLTKHKFKDGVIRNSETKAAQVVGPRSQASPSEENLNVLGQLSRRIREGKEGSPGVPK